MLSALIMVPLAVFIVVAYFLLRLAITRSRPVKPAPPTPDLRDEPPAVVNLLVNRMTDAPQVASATLLDLAARRVAEIHQVSDDPEHTLVRLRTTALPADSPGYERLVFDRVAERAGEQLTPISQLVERYADGGYHWQRRLVRDATLDARRLGLIRKSDGGFTTALVAAGLASAALLAPLWSHRGVVLFGAWLFLSLIAALLLSAMSIGERAAEGDRYTAKGREATAHWLGVAAWLRSHDALRELPPGAVAVWDRYLAYSAALDVSQHAVRMLDFEAVGHRDVLWSEHTGVRRQVRAVYWRRSRILRPLGPAAAQLRLIWAAITLPLWLIAGIAIAVDVTSPYPRGLLLVLVAVQVARAAYRLMRSIVDLARPVTVTGTVLDLSVLSRQRTADNIDGALDMPTHFFVVVDDGSTDVLRPWVVNRDLARGRPIKPRPPEPSGLRPWMESIARPSFEPGDQVQITGQGWSRYATRLRKVRSPATRSSAPAADTRG